jgi:hypothetical protein
MNYLKSQVTWIFTLQALVQDSNENATLYDNETCNACEDESFYYKINGAPVSGFFYHSWFEQFHKAGK